MSSLKQAIKKRPFKTIWGLIWAVPAFVFTVLLALCVSIMVLSPSAFREVFREVF